MTDATIHKPGHCDDCGRKLGGNAFFGAMAAPGTSLCLDCDDRRRRKAAAEAGSTVREEEDGRKKVREFLASRMIVTTEAAPMGLKIEARLGIVSADVAEGQGLFKDIAQNARDLVGGRSATLQNTLRNSRAAALEELKHEALALEADAIIGVTFTITNVSTGSATSMTLVSATGTAVRLGA